MRSFLFAFVAVAGLSASRIARTADSTATPAGWQTVALPSSGKDSAPLKQGGIAWYRCLVKVPANWAGQDVTLAIEQVDSAHEAWLNGEKIGGAGHFPPHFQSGLDAANRYVVPPEVLRLGAWNLIAIRAYDQEGDGGFKGEAPQVGTEKEHINLHGQWQFRTGDDPSWAGYPLNASAIAPDSPATFAKIEPGAVPRGAGGHKMAARGNPLTPEQAAKTFRVPDDLELELVLAEPVIAQPVFLNFDERGRMWVVQYRQYPAPAGLNVVSKDQFWRAVYDKVPEPPPRGPRGLDRISIHEDSDGDGTFDKHSIFIDGLNIATAVVKGRGGAWVLNPPYLLFYPDSNDDDIPDGPPLVHLEGFGLEDTHSVVNSLRWGPDGWLYAAQGSTVTANVRVTAGVPPGGTGVETAKTSGASRAERGGRMPPATAGGTPAATAPRRSTRPGEPPVYSQGQNIWRYHPEKHVYEIFAEGGGNAFGVEIDPQGRIFSGHNGGDTRGFHYMQGAYLRKGFEKHGELSNPYAFGYFPQMDGTKGERFTHNFILYHGGALPPRYEGKLFGVEPLQGRVVLSEFTPDGSTFKTRDLERVVTSSDSWFRPVDIKVGPDGAIYIADWYNRQVTHTRNQEGNIDASNGRIYRLKEKRKTNFKSFNLANRSSQQLIEITTSHVNEWFRQEALRLLYDRKDRTLVSMLTNRVMNPAGPAGLPAIWALNASAGLDESIVPQLLDHAEPQIRLWTTRLLGDTRLVSEMISERLVRLSLFETNVEVRAQLASTARRLPAQNALPIIANLLRHDEDLKEPRLALLCWWAIESKCESDREAVLRLFEDSTFWSQPMVEQQLLGRLMRRFAAAGSRRDLQTCAKLLQLSPSRVQSVKLMAGFEEAFKGRSLAGLPDELIQAMARHDVGSDAFLLRQGKPEAVTEALRIIGDAKAKKEKRLQFIEILGEVRQPAGIPVLLRLVSGETDSALRKAALTALLPYDDSRIGAEVVLHYNTFSNDVRAAAQTLLASRESWSLPLAEAVAAGQIKPAAVPPDVVRQIRRHKGGRLVQLSGQLWPPTGSPTSTEMAQRIQRLADVARSGKGNPYSGQKLFTATCAACHTIFARGGQVGPDLTSYQRGDLEAMMLHVVNPNAEIREGYETFLIDTKDGRCLSGFLVERDDKIVVLRGPDGQNITLDRKEITEMRAAGLSLMPEGLLDPLNDQEVRDLFAYLRSTQPLAN